MYNPIDISKFFLKKYGEENDITPMKLVKLVYIAHGWHVGITGNALIDENPEAWKYGPVIPRIYHYFKSFGRNRIKLDDIPENFDDCLPNNIQNFLSKIWEEYGKYSGIELSAKTHQVGTPWYITWHNLLEMNKRNNGLGIISTQIPDNLIKDYYEKKLLINKSKPA